MQISDNHRVFASNKKSQILEVSFNYLDSLRHDEIAKQFINTDFNDLSVHMQSCALANTYRSRLQHQVDLKLQFFRAHIVSCTLTVSALMFFAMMLI
jgi:hypothetical protein